MQYNIIHDNGQPLCFVGKSRLSSSIYNIVKDYREAQTVSFEDLKSKDLDWYSKHQFIVILSDVKAKIQIVNYLKQNSAHFFSLVNCYNTISSTAKIGYGTYIGGFNSLDIDDIEVGDHVSICTHNTLGHFCSIRNFCHVSHYTFINCAIVGQGTVIGTQVIICPPTHTFIEVAEYCNITSNSRITKNIDQPGTYYGTRMISNKDSQTSRIL
jgi:acetyltransferase-like isoleucine patch superfamily enzyme